jgi:hypothetical protein
MTTHRKRNLEEEKEKKISIPPEASAEEILS